MSINIKTLACNAACPSCYENEIRKYHTEKIDIDAMGKALSAMLDPKHNGPCLHGGEPLLMGKDKAANFFDIIFKVKGFTGIQTNGILIDDEWIDLFVRYKTSIGLSLDGDTNELNRGRGTDVKVILSNIEKMVKAGLSVSIISVLRRHNADEKNIDGFITFIKRMANDFGIYYMRTNPGIAFTPETIITEQLTNDELANAFCRIAEVCLLNKKYLWQPVRDIIEMLAGFGHATCNFRGCDVWATNAETPILGNGSLGNCMKGGGARDGIANLRANQPSNARLEALRQITINDGGCFDCEFWDYCNGGCPGEAIDNDYRNKTRFCEAYKKLFVFVKDKMEGLLPSIYIGTNKPLINLTADGTTWRKEAMKVPEVKVEPATKLIDASGHGDRVHGDSNDAAWRAANPQWGKK